MAGVFKVKRSSEKIDSKERGEISPVNLEQKTERITILEQGTRIFYTYCIFKT